MRLPKNKSTLQSFGLACDKNELQEDKRGFQVQKILLGHKRGVKLKNFLGVKKNFIPHFERGSHMHAL